MSMVNNAIVCQYGGNRGYVELTMKIHIPNISMHWSIVCIIVCTDP